ncbi:hypothetical protein [Geotalea uraniireducens]|uniref:Uncharacterized protein n=1 Tax=Geotalea uraniireducens (strain Rf4) TaxID=351605 RepID=A5G4H1_GEOUR|nr:hypothetical protein [Geotalea uraniireducens]ABQ26689.1 hypothetical protein Gura_2511 [Geotalea uraniireducens Rf4]
MECDSQKHKEHMCALKEKGDLELIGCLSTNPTVECGNCRAKADKPENVCNPVELPK